MSSRRLVYLTGLVMGVVFHSLYGQYLSFILLRFLILLPFVSLLVSLPAMLRVRVWLSASGASPRGAGAAARRKLYLVRRKDALLSEAEEDFMRFAQNFYRKEKPAP